MRRLLVLATAFGIAVVTALPAFGQGNPHTDWNRVDVFDMTNPCTGQETEFTFTETGTDKFTTDKTGDAHWVRRSHVEVTTADGFSGHGTNGFTVRGGDVFVGVQHQEIIMFDPVSGEKFKLHRNSIQLRDANDVWHNTGNAVSRCLGSA